MIDDVLVKNLTTHPDERGFFREIARFAGWFGVGQASHAKRVTDVTNGWHIHQYLSEIFYVTKGVVRVVMMDCRTGSQMQVKWLYRDNAPVVMEDFGKSSTPLQYQEVVLSEYDPKIVLVPHGVAHGYKILQETDLLIFSDQTYDTTRDDEGRIEYGRWGGNWYRDIDIR